MLYVLLNQDGTVNKFPYTKTDLKRDNPNTSFPNAISDETAKNFGAHPVKPAPAPHVDYTHNLVRYVSKVGDDWVEGWNKVPASVEEIAQRTSDKADEVRAMRDAKLNSSDWLVTREFESSVKGNRPASIPANVLSYRQALRDITNQQGFPWTVTWPEVVAMR